MLTDKPQMFALAMMIEDSHGNLRNTIKPRSSDFLKRIWGRELRGPSFSEGEKMHISKIRIQNFRLLKDTTLNLEGESNNELSL